MTNSDLFLYKIQLKVAVHPITGCWIYPGEYHRRKYPKCKADGRYQHIYRLMYEIFKGKPTQWVLHKCNNKACVNPSHLYDGSPKDNAADMVKAGTHHHLPQTHDPERRRQVKLAGMKNWRLRHPDYRS